MREPSARSERSLPTRDSVQALMMASMAEDEASVIDGGRARFVRHRCVVS